ncbi:two-component sensor histidine kinase [Streptomyces sp. AJS327]|nr:two-component sensor histidine kinase [Streptomyces sp. AJS327]
MGLSVAVTVGLLAGLRTPEAVMLSAVCWGVTLAPASTGAVVRNYRNTAAAERLRAEQTALLAEMDRTQAVHSERARMARELHDVVANHLSAIAIHSTAVLSAAPGARSAPGPYAGHGTPGAHGGPGERESHGSYGGRGTVDGTPGGAADATAAMTWEALGVIRENSVRGLAEMRRLIGLLRAPGDEEELTATPTLDAVDLLLDRAAAASACGAWTVGGTGAGDTAAALDDAVADRAEATSSGGGRGSEPQERGTGLQEHGTGLRFRLCDERTPGAQLPAPVDLAAYRIVQEAVTNALKHAAPGPVTIRLVDDPAGREPLSVRVTSPLPPGWADGGGSAANDAGEDAAYGSAPGWTSRAPGAGAGLIGMRERVELLGGQLWTGPSTGADGAPVWRVEAALPVREPAAERRIA